MLRAHHKSSRRKLWYLAGSLLVLVVGILFLSISKNQQPDPHVIIILSPHYDDAVLSLGGFMAKREHPIVVATFFTAGPTSAMSTSWDTNAGFASSLEVSPVRVLENVKALKVLKAEPVDYSYVDNQYRNASTTDNLELKQDLARDIQALIASYSDKTVDVYGPATFKPDINHPDHTLLHQAYLDVAQGYPQKNVTFYVYEDYPYVERYSKLNISSLEKNLEKDSGLLFGTVDYSLSSSNLRRKGNALKTYASQIKAFQALNVDIVSDNIEYTKSRCDQACEVVYKIFRITQ